MVDKESPFYQRETGPNATKPVTRSTAKPASKSAPKTATSTPQPTPLLRRPSDEVPGREEPIPTDPRAFQEYLNRRGATPPLTVDGIIGPKTRAAAAQIGVPVPGDSPDSQTSAPSAAPEPTTPAAPTPVPLTAAQITQTMREQYGYLGQLLDIPDVNAVLTDSVANELTPQQTLARLYDTATWKNTQASVRNWMALSGTDPASAQAQIEAQKQAISTTASTLGIGIGNDRLTQIATDSLKLGWNAQQINAAVGAEFQYKPGAQVGAVGSAEQQVRKMAKDYLVPLSDATLADWDRQVAMGTASPDTLKQYIITQAKGLFPTLAQQIDGGLTVQQLAEPYRQTAAQELDISPDSIDFTDQKWMRALSTTGPDGKPTMMGLSDWQKTLRTDQQYGWDRTKNGIAAGYRVGNALSQALGLRA